MSQIVIKKDPIPKDSIVLDDDKKSLFETVSADLSQFHEVGVSFINREIYLGEITHGSSMRFHKNLLALENISEEPIKIHIHSPGGLVEAGLAIYDVLKHSKNDITGLCWGVCASMSTLVLQGCKNRYLAPTCSFMMHEGTEFHHEMNSRNAIANGKESERHLILFYKIMEENCGLTSRQLEDLISHVDLFLTPQEAIDLGLADKILAVNQPNRKKKGVDAKLVKKIIDKKSYSQMF